MARALAAAALVVMTAMVSCGGGDEGAALPPASPNPCALLDRGQVQAVVGNAVAHEQVFTEGGGSLAGAKICRYEPPPQAAPSSGSGTLPTAVTLEVASAFPQEVLVKYIRTNEASGRLRPLPALGPQALWSDTFNRVVVPKGGNVVAISLRGDPSAKGYQDKAVTLASEALKRL